MFKLEPDVDFYLPSWDEENSLEFELTFDVEVLDGEVIFPIVGQALVEGGIIFLGDVVGIASLDGLGLVEFLVGRLLLLDFLGLLLLFFLLFVDLLNLGLLLIGLHLLFLVILDVLQLLLKTC